MSQQEEQNITSVIPYSDYQSVKHFCILSFFSFGLYPCFWMFKHWQYLRDEKGMNINASYRTSFTILYGYSLFKEFQLLADEKGYKKRLPLGLLFIFYLLLLATVTLNGCSLVLFSYFAFIALIPAHRMMNFYYLKQQEGYKLRKNLSKGEKYFLASIWLFLLGIIIIQIAYIV